MKIKIYSGRNQTSFDETFTFFISKGNFTTPSKLDHLLVCESSNLIFWSGHVSPRNIIFLPNINFLSTRLAIRLSNNIGRCLDKQSAYSWEILLAS